MIWLVRYVNLLLIAVLALMLLGLAVGLSGPEQCMYPEHNVVRPLPCDWKGSAFIR